MKKRSDFPSDSSTITVLYCGDLAPDDFMWSVACTVYDLFDLLDGPIEWVSALGQLPDWKSIPPPPNGITPPPVLTNHFQIRLAIRPKAGDDKILVQGISGTGIIRVSATQAGAQSALQALLTDHIDELQHLGSIDALEKSLHIVSEPPMWPAAYWNTFLEVLGLDSVSVDSVTDHTDATWFGHMRIYDPAWNIFGPEVRACWITCFLLMSLIDPYGYAGSVGMLLQNLVPGSLGDPFSGYTPAPNLSFTYTGDCDCYEECCDAIYGNTDTGGLVIVDSIVKNYKVIDPPLASVRVSTSANSL